MAFCSRVSGSLALLCCLILAPAGRQALGQVVFPSKEPCRLRTGQVGECLPINDCPAALQSFREQRPVRCGFEGSTVIVCCPKRQGTVGSPQTAVDVSSPPGYAALECGNNATRRIENFGETFSSPELRHRRRRREEAGVNQPFVVGGVPSSVAAWPWIALLGRNDSAGTSWFCGGTLINERWVLSAAHCFKDFTADVVRLGEHDYADDNDGASPKDFGVLDVVYYPDYSPPEAYHDLALLRLDSKVRLQKFILPVCLPFGEKIKEEMTDAVATVVGWGDTLFGGFPSSVLLQANVQVFPSSRCDRSYSSTPEYPTRYPRGIGTEMLCAGDLEGGKDACQGDSGGPLVTKDDSGRFVLAGVVSRGFGCGHRDYPGLYGNMRHAPYLAWIKKVAFGVQ